MASDERRQLTRTVGLEPHCIPDVTTEFLEHGDILLHCSDGLHAFVLDQEIRDAVGKQHPYDACRSLAALAEKRGGDDNLSLQLLEIADPESVVPKRKSAAAGPGELLPGMVLDDRFELTDLVSRSQMATIHRALDRQTGEFVAIKTPLMSQENNVAGYERFLREEEIGAELRHPSILRIHRVEGKSRPYMVMEFLEGETMADLLRHRKTLPEREAVNYAARICGALSYLHANGVVHRDLKPQNIMLCKDGSLRLLDFGIAQAKQSRRLTFAGFTPALGTPDYMSPEQVKGRRGDHRTDIYSLGAMLYEMTTGSTLFQGESPYVVMNARVTGDPVAPRKLNPNLTPVVEEIILHALERDPNKRFESARAMQGELENYELVELTERFLRLRSPQPWKNHRPIWLLIGGLLALQLLLFWLMWLHFSH